MEGSCLTTYNQALECGELGEASFISDAGVAGAFDLQFTPRQTRHQASAAATLALGAGSCGTTCEAVETSEASRL